LELTINFTKAGFLSIADVERIFLVLVFVEKQVENPMKPKCFDSIDIRRNTYVWILLLSKAKASFEGYLSNFLVQNEVKLHLDALMAKKSKYFGYG